MKYKCSVVVEMGDHLATIDIGQKEGASVSLSGRAGSPSKTMWPRLRSTSVPTGILIHPAVWPQQTWAENWGLCSPFLGAAGSQSNNVAWAEAYLHAKFHLDPSNRLATIHKRYRQTDRQRSDSMGRTVIQMVAQKSLL